MKPSQKIRYQLRIPIKQIRQLSFRYSGEMNARDQRLTAIITQEVFPAYEQNGFLTKDQFVSVCEWKSPRAKPSFESNNSELIHEISSLARTTKSERIRIQSWTLLRGVKWPTASVFLHFAFPDQYPILDVRALWSLGFDGSPVHCYELWESYTEKCRSLAKKAKVNMRELDQALWKYSQINQGKLGK